MFLNSFTAEVSVLPQSFIIQMAPTQSYSFALSVSTYLWFNIENVELRGYLIGMLSDMLTNYKCTCVAFANTHERLYDYYFA